MPGWYAPYFQRCAAVIEDSTDYADPAARLRNARTHTWLHPPGEALGALPDAGLALEHPRLPGRMFRSLVRDGDGLFTWPDRPWLPLAYSLTAREPGPAAAGA
jgi:hypothetical protein